MNRIENLWLQSGHFFGFHWGDGNKPVPMFYQVIGNEYTTLEWPFAAVAAQAASGWIEIIDTSNRKLIAPLEDYIMYDIFWGAAPGDRNLRVFEKSYGKLKRDMQGILDPATTTRVGYIQGDQSPFDDPSPITRFLTMMDSKVDWNFRNNNTTGGDSMTPTLKFYIMKYMVKLVTDVELVSRFLRGTQRITYFSLGTLDQVAVPPNDTSRKAITEMKKVLAKAGWGPEPKKSTEGEE